MNDKDLEIDNILNHKKVKKKIDGKAKGDRTELELCKLLTKHFGEEFSKAPGSGARWSQVAHLPEHAKMSLTGDLCVPAKYKWCVESKAGYQDDIDLNSIFNGKGIARLDEFIVQSERDSAYCGRNPIICWKRSRRPWLAMIHVDMAPNLAIFPYRIHYRNWIMIPLEELLLNTGKDFWFND